jgi:hypothetical protein
MTDVSPHLALPYLQPTRAQKHVNEVGPVAPPEALFPAPLVVCVDGPVALPPLRSLSSRDGHVAEGEPA